MKDFLRVVIALIVLVGGLWAALTFIKDDCEEAVKARDYNKWMECGCYHPK